MKSMDHEIMPNPVFIYDKTWHLVEINSAALKELGYTKRSQVMGKNILSLIHESDHKKTKEIIKNTEYGKSKAYNTIIHSGKTGKPVVFNCIFKKTDDGDDSKRTLYIESAFACGINKDKTDRRDIFFEYYNMLSRNISGLEVFLIDKSFHMLFNLGNETEKQGWRNNRDIPEKFSMIFPREVEEILLPLLKIGFESTPVSREFSMSGNYFSVRVIPLTNAVPEPLCILILQNITETRLIEKKSGEQ